MSSFTTEDFVGFELFILASRSWGYKMTTTLSNDAAGLTNHQKIQVSLITIPGLLAISQCLQFVPKWFETWYEVLSTSILKNYYVDIDHHLCSIKWYPGLSENL